MNKNIDSFYLSKKEPNKSCLLVLRDILLKMDENITETTKYGMPCFCFKGKMLFFLWVEKKSTWPYILFVNGGEIEHLGLEQNGRKQTKIFKVNPTEDIPLKTLKLLLHKAITNRRNKTK